MGADKEKLKEIFTKIESIQNDMRNNPDILKNKLFVGSMIKDVDEMLEDLSNMDQNSIVFDITQDLKMAKIILSRH